MVFPAITIVRNALEMEYIPACREALCIVSRCIEWRYDGLCNESDEEVEEAGGDDLESKHTVRRGSRVMNIPRRQKGPGWHSRNTNSHQLFIDMVDVLVQFVDSVPQPLTGALIDLGPLLAVLARSARLVEWSDDWYSSWLVLVGWWIVCLAGPILFRYALPLVIALTALVLTWIAGRRESGLLVTETVLQNALADLSTIRGALPEQRRPTPWPPIVTLRTAAFLSIPWLLLTYFISTQIILAVIGTVVLTHRAPWVRVLCSVIWRSAFVRSCVYRVGAYITGQGLPKYVVSNQPTPTTPSAVPSLRFLFTVYENQRWWMGLDWTAALLPSERPSWSSPSLHAVSPPNSFTLPEATTTYLPSADGQSRIKRTAVWRWEEAEWRLAVHKEGGSLSRVERTPPAVDGTQPSAQVPSGSRLLRAATRSSSASIPNSDADTPSDNTDQNHSEEPQTDPDGWIYADNKWENNSHRGGLGKVRLTVITHPYTHHSQPPPPLHSSPDTGAGLVWLLLQNPSRSSS